MAIKLGRAVEHLTVLVIPTDPFVCEITRKDGLDWPAAPTLEVIDGPTWVSELTGPLARFNVPSADVDAVIADPTKRKILLTVGGLVWASGLIQVQDA